MALSESEHEEFVLMIIVVNFMFHAYYNPNFYSELLKKPDTFYLLQTHK